MSSINISTSVPVALVRFEAARVPGKGWTVVEVTGSRRTGRAVRRAPGFEAIEDYTLHQAQAAAVSASSADPAREVRDYTYSAFTSQQDGATFAHRGTLRGAIAAASKYAHDAFPSWGYAGYGPTIVVRDDRGRDVHRDRL